MLDVPGRSVRNAAAALDARFGTMAADDLLAVMTRDVFPGRIAMVSSFGADSVALLHLVSRVAPDIPVLFIETGMHFAETIAYRNATARALGLTNVIDVRAGKKVLLEEDPDDNLHMFDPDACCAVRKVEPLNRALKEYDAWITGRRRDQSFTREAIPHVEADGSRVKINPLAGWTQADVDDYIERHALVRHPLVAQSYPSIGCAPCTSPVGPGEDPRSGRWRGTGKTECGLHFQNADFK
ncbi:phosphoadenylyl-sulfate reductase [Acuticoccus mangrovi]|uniref:Adenosine 5'-phosphosulfate reductase n=1 Tax=Acuticoccus mangrovi TaxID=2796142 RepID=A0A934IPI6_9HYPH|nr:phosphoadenylyl-sulfate reductase [Acuticoccus mangrovi]MBJ3775224.1 phosphoadenylyl-sulfate reductase [Acuticoccus mangrovi]